MKRIAAIVVFVLLGLVAAVIAVGYSLPVQHSASGEVVVAAPPEQVFALITDVGRYADWRSDITGVEVLSTTPARWREHASGDAITFETIETTPPSGWRVRIADPGLPFGGAWTYSLQPEGSGTRLRITEDGEVYNPIFRFVSRFVIGHTATIDQYLDDLTRRLTPRVP